MAGCSHPSNVSFDILACTLTKNMAYKRLYKHYILHFTLVNFRFCSTFLKLLCDRDWKVFKVIRDWVVLVHVTHGG